MLSPNFLPDNYYPFGEAHLNPFFSNFEKFVMFLLDELKTYDCVSSCSLLRAKNNWKHMMKKARRKCDP